MLLTTFGVSYSNVVSLSVANWESQWEYTSNMAACNSVRLCVLFTCLGVSIITLRFV